MAKEKKGVDKVMRNKEKVLHETKGFGEEGGEGDAY